MKEIIAIVRMKKTGATKKALISSGVAGFTAFGVTGRGKLVTEPERIEECREKLLARGTDDITDTEELEKQVTSFLDDSRPFPRRMFMILAYDEDVPRITEAVIKANQTDYGFGDGKIFVIPVTDAVRIRTGETGDAAIW